MTTLSLSLFAWQPCKISTFNPESQLSSPHGTTTGKKQPDLQSSPFKSFCLLFKVDFSLGMKEFVFPFLSPEVL